MLGTACHSHTHKQRTRTCASQALPRPSSGPEMTPAGPSKEDLLITGGDTLCWAVLTTTKAGLSLPSLPFLVLLRLARMREAMLFDETAPSPMDEDGPRMCPPKLICRTAQGGPIAQSSSAAAARILVVMPEFLILLRLCCTRPRSHATSHTKPRNLRHNAAAGTKQMHPALFPAMVPAAAPSACHPQHARLACVSPPAHNMQAPSRTLKPDVHCTSIVQHVVWGISCLRDKVGPSRHAARLGGVQPVQTAEAPWRRGSQAHHPTRDGTVVPLPARQGQLLSVCA